MRQPAQPSEVLCVLLSPLHPWCPRVLPEGTHTTAGTIIPTLLDFFHPVLASFKAWRKHLKRLVQLLHALPSRCSRCCADPSRCSNMSSSLSGASRFRSPVDGSRLRKFPTSRQVSASFAELDVAVCGGIQAFPSFDYGNFWLEDSTRHQQNLSSKCSRCVQRVALAKKVLKIKSLRRHPWMMCLLHTNDFHRQICKAQGATCAATVHGQNAAHDTCRTP